MYSIQFSQCTHLVETTITLIPSSRTWPKICPEGWAHSGDGKHAVYQFQLSGLAVDLGSTSSRKSCDRTAFVSLSSSLLNVTLGRCISDTKSCVATSVFIVLHECTFRSSRAFVSKRRVSYLRLSSGHGVEACSLRFAACSSIHISDKSINLLFCFFQSAVYLILIDFFMPLMIPAVRPVFGRIARGEKLLAA
jgi:hypothetical protein